MLDTKLFGADVFNDEAMKEYLSPEVYKKMHETRLLGAPLDETVAATVADAMKTWAVKKGATHYTHWFQPMTGFTAEKHESFLTPGKDGNAALKFSGKELIKGEPDASSFPNGGIRQTFEARGYTAWDPTSYAFVKDKTLYVPTAFCSYSGEALDKKTPLLRSTEALQKQALRVLKSLKNDAESISVSIGAEQEYFLVDKEVAFKREDLVFTGRTLFGAKPPKGQELEDHYYGAIKPRVKAFMEDLDDALWRLGIYAKTEHNEVAPAQHELAPVYSSVNIATDNNQLTMELMKKVADKHGLLCLLNEKPFSGVNGSGKHNNWSISTDKGVNLLDPGDTPNENLQFLVFLAAVIEAADDYQDLFRASVASAGNDNRLGGNEAPPAIISVYLGDDLMNAIEALETNNVYVKCKTKMKLGAKILPTLPKDATDRNRTSPLAFTGNKFEFRMVGSNDSVADCNVVINTTVAESLRKIADELETASDPFKAAHDLVVKIINAHKRIIYSGNNYSDEWMKEAAARGLKNVRTTPEAACAYTFDKNVKLFERHKVLSKTELKARKQIMLENYSRIVNIEALTMLDMAKKQIYPAVSGYAAELTRGYLAKKSAGFEANADKECIAKLNDTGDKIYAAVNKLDALLKESANFTEADAHALFLRDKVINAMKELRAFSDDAEQRVD